MSARTIVLTLVLCFVGVAECSADDANTGTWTLNEAKSKLGPGAPKNNIVVYEAAGDKVKVTIDGTDKDGNPAHTEWTGSSTGKTIPSPAIRIQTCARSRRSTTVRWGSTSRKAVRYH